MIDTRVLDELAHRVSALVAATPLGDIEKNLRAMLVSSLGRLDLVTREEFDLQRVALERAMNRIAELETKLVHIESATGR